MMAARDTARRGFTLLAVLIVMLAALLITTNLMFMTGADATFLDQAQQSVQKSGDVRSAVAVLLHECSKETARSPYELPQLKERYELYAAEGEQVSMRLLPQQNQDRYLESESAKLNINHADAAMLQAIGLSETVVQTIVERRESLGPVKSLGELLQLDGVTPQLLFGDFDAYLDRLSIDRESISNEFDIQFTSEPSGAFVDLLTVHESRYNSIDSRADDDVIDLAEGWDESMRRTMQRHLNEELCEALQPILEAHLPVESEHDLVMAIDASGIAHEHWPAVWALCHVELVEHPRIDINTASRAVLASLPGFTPELASQVIQRRETLDADLRASRLWPVVTGIVQPEDFAHAVEWVDMQTKLVRLRFAVERRTSSSINGSDGPVLIGSVLCEAIIDLSGSGPELAFLREITTLGMRVRLTMRSIEDLPAAPETAQFDVQRR